MLAMIWIVNLNKSSSAVSDSRLDDVDFYRECENLQGINFQRGGKCWR